MKKYPIMKTFRISGQKAELAKLLAELEGKSFSEWMREAVWKYLEYLKRLEEDPEFREKERVKNDLRKRKWILIDEEEEEEPLIIDGEDFF